MSASQNMIHSSAINLAYGNKASASRCSILIESIFESKILPELEKAISNKIPEGVLVELSKLEINIGRIEEKELPEKLAARIRESLEDALYNKFDLKNRFDPNSKKSGIKNQEKYLLESLELFLAKGYFPFDADNSFDIDGFVSLALHENRKELLELVRKFGRHQSSTKRITYTLKEKTVDKLVSAVDPVNSKWITDFRKILIYTKKDRNFTRLSDAEFIQKINHLILNFLLNETSLVFNREKFANYILNEINDTFKPDHSTLIQSLKKQTGNVEISGLISASLSRLQENRNGQQPTKHRRLDDDAELKDRIPETSEIQTNSATGELSGDELFDSIEWFLIGRDFTSTKESPSTIDDLISSALSQNPDRLRKLVQKYSQYDAVIRRIVFSTRTEWFDRLLGALIPNEADWISEFKNVLIFAQKESKLSSFRTNDFGKNIDFSILKHLLTKTGQTINRQAFSESVLKQFVNVPASEIQQFNDAVKSYPEDKNIPELIGKTLGDIRNISKDNFTGENAGEPDIDKLIKALNSGQIQLKYASRHGLKHEIIRAISNRTKKERFFNQLNETGAEIILELYYPERGAELLKFISSFFEEVINPAHNANPVNLHAQKMKSVLEMVLYSAARQNEQPNKEELVLFLTYSQGLNAEQTIKSEPFTRFIQAQNNISFRKLRSLVADEKQFSGISTASDLLAKEQQIEIAQKEGDNYQTSPAEAYDTVIRRKIMDTYLITGQLPPSYSDLTKNDLQIIFHELIRQKDEFLTIRLKKYEDSGELTKHLKKLITDRSAGDLEKYLAHFFPGEFSAFMKLFADLKLTFSANESNQLPDKKLVTSMFLEVLSESEGDFSPDIFSFTAYKILSRSHETNLTDLELLMHFLPEATATREYLKNMPQTGIVGIFEFLSHSEPEVLKKFIRLLGSNEKLFGQFISESAETEKLSEKEFVSAFTNRLQQKLSASNEGVSFQAIAKEISLSGKMEIRSLAELWQVNKTAGESQPLENQRQKEVDSQNFEHRITRLFPALKFYSNNGFLPWWSDQLSFGEIVTELHFLSQTRPVSFEEAFTEAENEDPVFEKLLPKLSQSVVNELEHIFRQHKQLHSVWNDIKRKSRENSTGKPVFYSIEEADFQHLTRKDFSDSGLLYKAIYFKKDKALLKKLFGFSPEIQNQLKNYLSLASAFHFQMIKPIQWRKAVFEFSLTRYKPEISVPDQRFAVDFIDYLKTQYPQINWEESFKAVYRKLQSSKGKNDITFPQEIIDLFGLKPEQEIRQDSRVSKQKSRPAIDETGLEIKVHNSGLVLFWPFLNRLFERLTLVENNAFINPEGRNRAVYILQYLAYNGINFPEYNLVLNKLLVGMPTEEHLVPFIELTEEEKDSTRSLLNGLISNWEKVKNSSPEAIQETFLQREGTLKFQTDGILLEVGKKTVDVLMGSIPWSTSVVRLPWMKKPVFVKWI